MEVLHSFAYFWPGPSRQLAIAQAAAIAPEFILSPLRSVTRY
ncbi:MAG: hypothetical protein ACFBSG_10760 [Leptolyngbyaceae cyanobacterium]